MPDHPVLVTAAQMRELEERSVRAGATWDGLMQQAGCGVAEHAREMLGDAQAQRVLVLVGPGNNGGDGLVAARYLHDWGAHVTLYIWKRRADPGDANWQATQERNLPTVHASDDPRQQQVADLLKQADLVIDGLLGVGVSRPLTDEIAAIVEAVNAAAASVLAIDVPSGLDADTGAIWAHIIAAERTVATGLIKRGHRLYPGAAHVGRVVVAPIDLPASFEESQMTTELNSETLRSLLPARPDDSHKGTYGKAMVVAGSYFYPGAATLAATAATRSGAGLVTLACPRSIYGGTLAALHEATYLPLPESEVGALSPAAAAVLTEKLDGYTALLIGCGLGREESTGEFLQRVLGLHTAKRKVAVGFLSAKADDDADEQPKLPPLVLDADGLNLLSGLDHWPERLRDHPTVLTPHPGEMARLLGVEQIEDDHPQVALDAARQWGVVVVLKGAHTVVAAPDGRNAIHGHGNAALATAGTGDVLAGLIAGLLAQGLEPFDAARLGVGVHALAGAIVRDELGVRGVIAGDLLPRLPLAFRQLEQRSR